MYDIHQFKLKMKQGKRHFWLVSFAGGRIADFLLTVQCQCMLIGSFKKSHIKFISNKFLLFSLSWYLLCVHELLDELTLFPWTESRKPISSQRKIFDAHFLNYFNHLAGKGHCHYLFFIHIWHTLMQFKSQHFFSFLFHAVYSSGWREKRSVKCY